MVPECRNENRGGSSPHLEVFLAFLVLLVLVLSADLLFVFKLFVLQVEC